MKVVCAWCGKIIKIDQDSTRECDGDTSHGICEMKVNEQERRILRKLIWGAIRADIIWVSGESDGEPLSVEEYDTLKKLANKLKPTPQEVADGK